MAVETERLSPAEHLERRIAALDAEVEQIRAEYGDPAKAMGDVLREWLGVEAMQETSAEYRRNRYDFLYDDDDAEEEDGRESG